MRTLKESEMSDWLIKIANSTLTYVKDGYSDLGIQSIWDAFQAEIWAQAQTWAQVQTLAKWQK